MIYAEEYARDKRNNAKEVEEKGDFGISMRSEATGIRDK